MIPTARTNGHEIEERNDSLIITDEQNNKIIELDRLTGLVWKSCNGEKSPWEIQTELKTSFGVQASEDEVWQSLSELTKMNLLFDNYDSIERYSTMLEWEEDSLKPAPA